MPSPSEKDLLDLIQAPKDLTNKISVASEDIAAFKAEVDAFDEQSDDIVFERKARYHYFIREIRQIDEIIASRKEFANKIYDLIVNWLIGLALLIICSAWKIFDFNLDEKVMLAILGGTTLSVLGIFTIVANFLFPKNGHAIFSRSKGTLEGQRTHESVTRKRASPTKTPANPQ